jgi:GT2 family glycosyltransferase
VALKTTVTSLESYDYPHVSIIILTYNGAGYILPLLKSLADQTYPQNFVEIIVIDNASTDNTLELIQDNYDAVKIIPLKKNIGFAAGNNEGYLHARHDLLVFLNQDTICQPDFLKILVSRMQQDPSLAACNPNIIPVASSNSFASDRRSPVRLLHLCDLSPFGYGRNRIISDKYFIYTKLLSGCAFIIRRNIVKKLGYLYDDQLYMYAEDTDLSLRIHSSGGKIGAIKDAIIYHLHDRNPPLKRNSLLLAAGAIKNRVYIFFKNMETIEFLIFYPLLLLGGNFKIFEFSMPATKKFVYFIPFSLFSTICMLWASFRLNRFSTKKRHALRSRRKKGFTILKLILKI